jgi:hypothetical protein
MRDINRIERICHDLERLWKQHPDQRLGQLLENYVFPPMIGIIKTKAGGDASVKTAYLWSQEDDETDKKIIMETDFQNPSSLCVDSSRKDKP